MCPLPGARTMWRVPTPPWPSPTGVPVGSSGWYLANDGHWYRSDSPPAPGYVLGSDGRWTAAVDPWRRGRWGLGDFWWGVLAYVGGSIVLGLVVAVVVAATDDRPGTDLADVELGPYAISCLVLANVVAFFGIPWLASHRKGLGRLADDFGLRLRPVDVAIGLGLGIAALIAAAVVGTLIDTAFDVEETTSNIPVDALVGWGEFTAFFVAVAVVTPVIEELFFRGLLYRSFLKRGAPAWRAIIWTTLIFVAPHLTAATSLASLASLAASIGVLGLMFNVACQLVQLRLGAAIVAHLVVNGTAVIALAVS